MVFTDNTDISDITNISDIPDIPDITDMVDMEALRNSFNALDKNEDGSLTLSEVTSVRVCCGWDISLVCLVCVTCVTWTTFVIRVICVISSIGNIITITVVFVEALKDISISAKEFNWMLELVDGDQDRKLDFDKYTKLE